MLFFGSNNNNELMMLVWIQSTSRLFSTRSLGQQRLPSRCGNRNWIRRSDWQRLFLDYPKAFTFTCINLISCWPWGRSSALPLGSRVDCRGENLYRKKCLWLSDLLQTAASVKSLATLFAASTAKFHGCATSWITRCRRNPVTVSFAPGNACGRSIQTIRSSGFAIGRWS